MGGGGGGGGGSQTILKCLHSEWLNLLYFSIQQDLTKESLVKTLGDVKVPEFVPSDKVMITFNSCSFWT